MKKLLLIIMMCMFLGFVSGAVYKQSSIVDIKFRCTNTTGSLCSTAANCNTTLYDPDNNLMFNNSPATNQMSSHMYFNITLNETHTAINGENCIIAYCCDSGDGDNPCDDTSFCFEITPNGEETSTGEAILYLAVILLLIIFLVLIVFGFSKAEMPSLKLLSLYGIYLTLIGISYMSWIMSVNFLTASAFIGRFFWIIFVMLMVAFLPILLASIAWYIWLLTQIKHIRKLIDKGIPEDEAYNRSVRGSKWIRKATKKW